MTHNAFMVEGFVDELAATAKKDPVEYRRALFAKAPRARAVLDLAADKAGWRRALPTGSGRGVSVIFGFGSYVARRSPKSPWTRVAKCGSSGLSVRWTAEGSSIRMRSGRKSKAAPSLESRLPFMARSRSSKAASS